MQRANYLLLLFLVSFYACHKDNGCPNVAPADFTISEIEPSNLLWKNYTCDTNSGEYELLSAINPNLQYEWHVGSAVYTTQQVEVNFAKIPNNYVYPITLIVHKTADAQCYDGSGNTDTVTKNMTIDRTDHLFYGQWRGQYIDTNTNRPISDTLYLITIKKGLSSEYGFPDTVAAIYGIPYTDSIADVNMSYATTYKEFTFYFDFTVHNVWGNAIVDSTNNGINISYTYNIDTTQIRRTFKGVRQ